MATSSVIETRPALARQVTVTDETLLVELKDGRAISVPLLWFPRLAYATTEERARCRFIGEGEGIHWPDLDEDVSIEGLMQGRGSGESQSSLQKWLDARGNGA